MNSQKQTLNSGISPPKLILQAYKSKHIPLPNHKSPRLNNKQHQLLAIPTRIEKEPCRPRLSSPSSSWPPSPAPCSRTARPAAPRETAAGATLTAADSAGFAAWEAAVVVGRTTDAAAHRTVALDSCATGDRAPGPRRGERFEPGFY